MCLRGWVGGWWGLVDGGQLLVLGLHLGVGFVGGLFVGVGYRDAYDRGDGPSTQGVEQSGQPCMCVYVPTH